MSLLKKYSEINVLNASKERISFIFDNFEKIYISFSAGKDSTVMLHLVMEEAIKRKRKIGLLLIDLEAQYNLTMQHAENCIKLYEKYLDIYWICLPIALRNAVSNFEPRWLAWDKNCKDQWVRNPPEYAITDVNFFPFFQEGYEFEEFVPEFGEWYSEGKPCACLVGIRTDESLNRFRTIALKTKIKFKNKNYTTKVTDNTYNIYPIYDWAVSDLWHYHYLNPSLPSNKIYEQMHKAGLSPSQMRICQPYGDDQKRGLWLYHILEPATWYKVVNRVNGVNSGALYIQETGNITGYNKINKPSNHTWKSFCNLLLSSLPKSTQKHYITKFKVFLKWWKHRGYENGIPEEAPAILESKRIAPSWRRLCKVLLRNDYWCKGLGFTQPKSAAYGKYLELKKNNTLLKAPKLEIEEDLRD
jgi:predicted phosphoadenosine phosphosulfate sulfurtransferase